MNKPVKWLLVLSIAVNAIWVIGVAAGWFALGKTAADVARADVKKGALSPGAAREVVALLSTNDAARLRDELRALGLPDDVVRGIVGARIQAPYSARYQAIQDAAREAEAQRPYWQRSRFGYGWDTYTSEQLNELVMLDREARKQAQALGAEGKPDWNQIIREIRYAFLPPDKAARLSEMQIDYDLLDSRIRQEMDGFRMPGDDAALKLLAEERKRDTEALLSPEEREAKDLRDSATADKLRRAFAGFDATEDEYKAVFALQHALDEKYSRDAMAAAGGDTAEFSRARDEAQKEVEAQIKATLGDARYEEYLRGQRGDYQSLLAAARRFNLSADTVAQTYQVRDNTANEAARISGDASLSAEQKNAAYAELAGQATAQIKAALGDEVGAAYIDNALVWLKKLPQGGNVKLDPRGNVNVSQPKQESP